MKPGGGEILCYFERCVFDTVRKKHIKPQNQAGKSLFMSCPELDLSNHAVPKQSGKLVIERSMDISQ